MRKLDAINFFGNKARLAKAAGVYPSAIHFWGDLVPERNAMRLQIASGEVLKYDPEVYANARKAKAKRKGALTDENHTTD